MARNWANRAAGVGADIFSDSVLMLFVMMGTWFLFCNGA